MAAQTRPEIDLSLTPENVKDRGSSYLYDIFDHDPLIKSFLEEKGYKLGKAVNDSVVVSAGLFEPIGNRTQEQDPQPAI